MIFELETVSRKKFLISALFGALVTVIVAIYLGILLGNGVVTVVMMIVLFAVTIYVSHIIAITTSNISIDENSFQLNNQEIFYDTIAGYFVNETGLTMTALDLKLKSNSVVNITGLTLGKRGKRFKKFISQLINAIKSKITYVEEFTYQDIYVKQVQFLKPFVYVAIPLTLILDLFFLYQFAVNKQIPPWQLLLINSTLFSLIPYLRRRKNK